MPCDSGPSWEDIERDKRRMDTLVRLACDHCRLLESRGVAVPAYAREFWEEHKVEDAAREREEAAEAERKRLRASAKAKLTKEELEALRG